MDWIWYLIRQRPLASIIMFNLGLIVMFFGACLCASGSSDPDPTHAKDRDRDSYQPLSPLAVEWLYTLASRLMPCLSYLALPTRAQAIEFYTVTCRLEHRARAAKVSLLFTVCRAFNILSLPAQVLLFYSTALFFTNPAASLAIRYLALAVYLPLAFVATAAYAFGASDLVAFPAMALRSGLMVIPMFEFFALGYLSARFRAFLISRRP